MQSVKAEEVNHLRLKSVANGDDHRVWYPQYSAALG